MLYVPTVNVSTGYYLSPLLLFLLTMHSSQQISSFIEAALYI